MKARVFTFFNDPGHGWLEVPVSLLKKLGIIKEITSYSYFRGQSAFLEEDNDWSVFDSAMKLAGIKYGTIDTHTDYDSPVRDYRSFNWKEHQ